VDVEVNVDVDVKAEVDEQEMTVHDDGVQFLATWRTMICPNSECLTVI